MTQDLDDLLAGAFAADPDRLAALRGRLAAAAADRRLLDVSYRTVDSPIGTLLLAATEIGVVRVAFEVEDQQAVLQELADRVSPRMLPGGNRLDETARELEQYFAGQRRQFAVPLDWRLSTGFRSRVLHRLPDIGYGSTASYGQVAELAGSPRAVRAVGTACATNPLPLLVPCHRVVRSDGALGNYRGGVPAKRVLLDLETVEPEASRRGDSNP